MNLEILSGSNRVFCLRLHWHRVCREYLVNFAQLFSLFSSTLLNSFHVYDVVLPAEATFSL